MANKRFIPNKAVYWKKPQPFPPCVIFFEPVITWEEHSEIKWTMSARSWLYAIVRDSNTDDADMDECWTNEECLDVVEQCLLDDDKVVLVMHGVQNCIHLMEFSEYFRGAGFTAECYFVGRERAFVEVVRGKQKVVVCDIRNWIPGEPQDIGDWAGQHVDVHPRWWPDEDEFGGYHAQVMFALVAGWGKYIQWNRENDLGGFCYSMSSLAYAWWTRSKGAEHSRHPRNKQTADMEKAAFYGGFCYVHSSGYHNGDGYYLLDCNGLYGSVIRDSMLPFRHVTTRRVVKPTDLDNALKRGGVIARGLFSLDQGYLPVRGIRSIEWQQKEVECWLPQPELLWVMEHGKIHRLDTLIVYDMKQLGKDIGEYALQQRFIAKEQGKKYESKLWKLFITNFFGKLAQRFGTIHVFPADPEEPDHFEQFISATTGKIYSVCVFCGTKIVSIDDGESTTYIPSISAFITSYGRRRLWELCTMAGWHNVFYNDTDSLIVNRAGYRKLKHLISDNVPGLISLDEKGDTLEILGKKQYRIGSVNKDNTHPSHYQPSADGTITWIEKESQRLLDKESAGSITVRRAWAKAWDQRLADLREIHSDIPF